MLKNWWEINFFNEDLTAFTGVNLGANSISPFYPLFKRKMLKITKEEYIFRDENGKVLRRKSNELEENIAEYLHFPLEDPINWPYLRNRLDPENEGRYCKLKEFARSYKEVYQGRVPVIQRISGAYRTLWHLMGDVGLSYAFYDHQDLVHQIMEQWLKLQMEAIKRILKEMEIHVIDIREDLCSNI